MVLELAWKMHGKKLYIGHLPHSVTDARLIGMFSPHGTIESARVVADQWTGRSRGFAFVEMSSQSEAQKALEALNGTHLEGQILVVNEAKPKEKRTGGGGRHGW